MPCPGAFWQNGFLLSFLFPGGQQPNLFFKGREILFNNLPDTVRIDIHVRMNKNIP